MGLEDKWVEIFRAGEYPQGKISEQDLDQVVADYSPSRHEAPVVIGHPADNHPAWAWTETLRRQGKVLLAKFKNVQPAFEEMLQKGLFKKRSASFYRNYPEGGKLYLRHVGFLGARPPEVKGLKDIFVETHAEDGTVQVLSFEFGNINHHQQEGGRRMSILDKLKGLIKEAEEQDPGAGGPGEGGAPGSFSEAELKQRIEAAVKEATDKLMVNFEEQIRNSTALKEAKEKAEERVGQIEKERDHEKVVSFCETLKRDGKLIPAWEKLGIVKFIESLSDGDIIEFSDEVKVSARKWFMDFLKNLGKVINFKEIAPRGGDLPADAGKQLKTLAKEKMKAEKIEFKDAFEQAQMENPALAEQYLAEIRGNQ